MQRTYIINSKTQSKRKQHNEPQLSDIRRIQRKSAYSEEPVMHVSSERVAERRKERKRDERFLKLFIWFLAAMLIVGLASALDFQKALSAIANNSGLNRLLVKNKKEYKLLAKENLYEEYDPSHVFASVNRVNILLYGLDRDSARKSEYTFFRPDSIMVASIDFENKTISLISVPRDTRVHIAGTSEYDKINSSFMWGGMHEDTPEARELAGMRTLRQTIKSLTGLNINYCVGIDMSGAVKIVNTIGGVTTDVKENIYVKGSLAIPKGDNQTLNGLSFLRYARYRDYALGDIERVKVQQRLLKDLFKAAVNPANIMKAPQLITQTISMVQTDMDAATMTALGFSVSEFDFSDIHTATIPGYFLDEDDISYWGIDEGNVREFINNFLNGGQ